MHSVCQALFSSWDSTVSKTVCWGPAWISNVRGKQAVTTVCRAGYDQGSVRGSGRSESSFWTKWHFS